MVVHLAGERARTEKGVTLHRPALLASTLPGRAAANPLAVRRLRRQKQRYAARRPRSTAYRTVARGKKGVCVAADKAAIQRVQVPPCQLPDSGT